MLKLLEDMHITHKKYVCCFHAWDEDACKILGSDSCVTMQEERYPIKVLKRRIKVTGLI
jgi:hypothetical protein